MLASSRFTSQEIDNRQKKHLKATNRLPVPVAKPTHLNLVTVTENMEATSKKTENQETTGICYRSTSVWYVNSTVAEYLTTGSSL